MIEDSQQTIGDIYENIAEMLATARTKHLQRDTAEALGLFQEAQKEFTRFRSVLKDYAGYHALEHAYLTTLDVMQQKGEK